MLSNRGFSRPTCCSNMRPNAPMPEAAPPAKRRSLLHAETAIYSSSSDGSESPRSSEVEKAKWPGEKRLCAQAPSWAGLVAEVSRRAPPTFVSPAAGEHGDRSMPTRLHHEAQLEEMLIVVVPFRRRGVHLRIMLSTVSRYLDALVQHQLIQAPQRLQLNPKQERRRQEGWPAGKTGYCFIVAEQRDPRPFHRGKISNCEATRMPLVRLDIPSRTVSVSSFLREGSRAVPV